MLRTPKEKICICGNAFIKYNSLQKYCSINCEIKQTNKESNSKTKKLKKPIRKISVKQQELNKKYYKIRAEFLSDTNNQICPITFQKTTDVHHKKGRKGFADNWAKENNIPLIIDVRFFLAVSRDGHNKIENNPSWAYENGFSIHRNK